MNNISNKHKTYFAFLAGLFIVYFIVFIKTFISLNDEFHFAFKSKENYSFHKKYSKKLHHIRDENNLSNLIVREGVEDLLFTNIHNEGKRTIIFQGDSWINQIETAKNDSQKISFNDLKKFAKEKKIKTISAGIPSYSPSLMNLQLDVLENDFNIKPEIVIAFINQLDFGDELCRYKKNKIYTNGKFKKILTESDHEGIGWYNYSKLYGISDINFSYNSDLLKSFHLINFKINYSLKKSLKRIKKKILRSQLEEKKCYNNQIEKYLINPKQIEIQYFEKTITEYLDKIDQKKHIKKLILVSFPHKKHFAKSNNQNTHFNYNVAESINKVIISKDNIIHLDFSKILLNEPNFDYINIWAKDEVHLNPDNHSKLFIKNILKEINKLL